MTKSRDGTHRFICLIDDLVDDEELKNILQPRDVTLDFFLQYLTAK